MSSSTLAIGTIGIIVIGLGAVFLILSLAVASLVNHWRRAGN